MNRFIIQGMKMIHSNYKSSPLPIGIEVFGVDLKRQLDQVTVERIKEDVTKHRLVVFRNQGVVDGHRQVEISKWFGEIDNVSYAKHPMSPNIDIFRVSNDPVQGCTGVGITGWHIDGTFRSEPYSHSIYHMVSVAKSGGDTMFIPLTQVVESFSPEQREFLNHVWMLSDRCSHLCHPLIYPHPLTGRPTMCFHQGMTSGFVRDYDPTSGKLDLLNEEENKSVISAIQSAIESVTVYSHKWLETGDFILSDNLAVGHRAGSIPSSVETAGLRILHRVTVAGKTSPCKNTLQKQDCCY
ncbi:alpha-ketoglutarate-dependent sulfate ester dioxygenase-like [Ciona intestinalis]